MNYYFVRVCTDATTSHIREVGIDGRPRGEPIDPENIGYVEYVRDVLGGDAGKIEKVAGNTYVTFNDEGTPIYDGSRATADAMAVLWAQVRAQRDGLITAITWRAERYERQIAAGIPTNDTETQYRAILIYIQALRDITKQENPSEIAWPEIPE